MSNTNQALEEMETAMQTLRDQNSLLRAQVNQTPVTTNGLIAFGDQQHQPPTMNGIGSSSDNKNESSVGGGGDQKKTEEEKKQLERELKIRDEIIHELEMRLADVKTPPLVPSSGGDLLSSGPTKIEVDMLNSQLQALQMTVANKEAELDRVQSELSDEKFKVIEQGDLMKAQVSKALEELKEVKSEQEDLLLMLADQDVKLRDYRARLRALGQVVEDEDDEE